MEHYAAIKNNEEALYKPLGNYVENVTLNEKKNQQDAE